MSASEFTTFWSVYCLRKKNKNLLDRFGRRREKNKRAVFLCRIVCFSKKNGPRNRANFVCVYFKRRD
jgi:hypothetical protein